MIYFTIAVIVFWVSLIGLSVWRVRYLKAKEGDRDYQSEAVWTAVSAPLLAILLALLWIAVIPLALIVAVVYYSPKVIDKF